MAAASVHDEEERLAGRALLLGITDPADPDALWGNISLYDIDPHNQRAATGYWPAAPARGRGSATRALRLLSRWAFDTLGLARLELTCGPDNTASQRVAERAGFVREGMLRSHLTFKNGRRDTVVYGLLPSDRRRMRDASS